jgi:hypothetical protein
MLILISLNKLSNRQKRSIKKFYSVIEYNDKIHSKKNIEDFGHSEVILFQICPSVLRSLTKNLVFKYLTQHKSELEKPVVCFIYDKSKYKGILKDIGEFVNLSIRKMPMIRSKSLQEILKETHEDDEETPSLIRMDSFTNESAEQIIHPEIIEVDEPLEEKKEKEEDDIFSGIIEKYRQQQNDIKQRDVEISGLKKMILQLNNLVSDLGQNLKRPELKRQAHHAPKRKEPAMIEELHPIELIENGSALCVVQGDKVLEKKIHRTLRQKNRFTKQLKTKYKIK